MKKIGIISLYYKNYNFGGCLQAYALVRILRQLGFQAEQISYDRKFSKNLSFKDQSIIFIKQLMPGNYFHEVQKNILRFKNFMAEIPHTPKVYTEQTIGSIKDEYDVFVAGSDQIWNPNFSCDAYYLGFVDDTKIKISYAASVGNIAASPKSKEKTECLLKRFDAISVREHSAVSYLYDQFRVKSVVVLDPVFLLGRGALEELAKEAVPSKNPKPYAVVYLLGNQDENRRLSEVYANNLSLPLYSIPTKQLDHSLGRPLYGVGPKEFVKVLKEAELIITDSFHAIVVSILFHKKSIILRRNGSNDKNNMNSRVEDIFQLFQGEFHWNDENPKGKIDEKIALNCPNWEEVDRILEKERAKSIKFLSDNLIKRREG